MRGMFEYSYLSYINLDHVIGYEIHLKEISKELSAIDIYDITLFATVTEIDDIVIEDPDKVMEFIAMFRQRDNYQIIEPEGAEYLIKKWYDYRKLVEKKEKSK